MEKRLTLILALTAFFIVPTGLAFSQDEQTVQGPPASQQPASGAAIQWLWGEVVSVDAAAKQLNVKYLDYENDLEKEILLNADENTRFENAKSLDDIKVQDNLSIDYIVTAEGKNIAKNISLEKEENAQDMQQISVTPEEPIPQAPPESIDKDVESVPGYKF